MRFAYFSRRRWLFFRNFADQAERIEEGLRSFDMAASAGWQQVEAALGDYEVLPDPFFAGSAQYFAQARREWLSAA